MQSTIKIPEIRFQYGFLLDQALLDLRSHITDIEKKDVPSFLETKEMIAVRHQTWKKVEKEIIEGMQDIADINFYQDLIDVYFVHAYKRAFSDPMVLSLKYEGERLIDILTHEILHRLLTDNIQKKDGSKWARENYPDQSDRVVTNHILVHAIHKEIYLNVIHSPERLKNDVDFCQNFPAY
jgi:hypothetical protein